jgi:hypothetical protein
LIDGSAYTLLESIVEMSHASTFPLRFTGLRRRHRIERMRQQRRPCHAADENRAAARADGTRERSDIETGNVALIEVSALR